MKSLITRWKVQPLKCRGRPDLPLPFSPTNTKHQAEATGRISVQITSAECTEVLSGLGNGVSEELLKRESALVRRERAGAYDDNTASSLTTDSDVEKHGRVPGH